MTYADQADLSRDPDFRERIAAVAAVEGFSTEHPTTWADQHQWYVAAEPGLADAYSYAVANGVEHPGRDATVITDEQLLAACTAVAEGG